MQGRIEAPGTVGHDGVGLAGRICSLIEIVIEIGKLPEIDFDHDFDFDYDPERRRHEKKIALAQL
jgi:hypothetical protein